VIFGLSVLKAQAQEPNAALFFESFKPRSPFYDRYFQHQQTDSTYGKAIISSKQMVNMQWLVGKWTITSKGYTKTNLRKDGKQVFEWKEPTVEFLLAEDHTLYLAGSDSLVVKNSQGQMKRLYLPQPFLKYDPFNQVWILVGGYDWGALVSQGWQNTKMVFIGRIMLAGLVVEERQTWMKRSEQELYIRYEELLRNGEWFLSEENIYRKASSRAQDDKK
jgi:hypothetical protein